MQHACVLGFWSDIGSTMLGGNVGEARHRHRAPAATSADLSPASGLIHDVANPQDDVLVVGVGASAGGLDAFTELLQCLPATPGFALVFVQHLQPDHSSDLALILDRKTAMPVVQVEQGAILEVDHVYVIPPNTEMRVEDGTFVLSPRPSGPTPSLTVNIFLTSLAEEHENKAIGVILSGSASDGTKGLAAIVAANGITLVQDPSTAAHRGMPDSAIAAGVADMVLSISDIADELVRLARHPYIWRRSAVTDGAAPDLPASDTDALAQIVTLIRQSTGLDMSQYKRPTMLRRLQRRMALRRTSSLSKYAIVLSTEPLELAALFDDMLVQVTSFFRDPEVFEALQAEAFPSILGRKDPDAPVRIWVPGCATGQEAYSIAIALAEYLEAHDDRSRVQIFASDLREADLAIARGGVYPPDTAVEVSEERLNRFFTRVERGFQVSKHIREMCVFARHDVTSDPPFARLDLVSCRNLLIYLEAPLQRRILGSFHYALLPGGILMLGDSETAGAAPGLFKRASHKGLFKRLPGSSPRFAFDNFGYGVGRPTGGSAIAEPPTGSPSTRTVDAQRQFDRMLLDRFAPAAVLVDDQLEIRQLRGDAGEYLTWSPGEANLSLKSAMSVGMYAAVDSAICEAKDTGAPARREAIRSTSGAQQLKIAIVAVPFVSDDEVAGYAILFDDRVVSAVSDEAAEDEATETHYLRQELAAATDALSRLREGRDAAYEALRAANEEIQSNNEELQSMNEELDTAKEELQSTNEELVTLNDELGARNTQLTQSNDDLNNLLVSASIAMLVLGRDMAVRRFTAQAADAFNLIEGDVGRKVTDVRWRLDIPDIEDVVDTVSTSGRPITREVPDSAGRWYSMSVRPYMTSENQIDGTIITLFDIDELHESRRVLERAQVLSESTARIVSALGTLEDPDRSLREAVDELREGLHAHSAQVVSLRGDDAVLLARSPDDDSPPMPCITVPEGGDQVGLRAHAERGAYDILTRDESGRFVARLYSSGNTLLGAVCLAFEDASRELDLVEQSHLMRIASTIAMFLERLSNAEVLEQLVVERTARLEETTRRLASSDDVKNVFLANMSHELRTPLNSIIGFSTMLLDEMAGEVNEEQRRQLSMILGSGRHLLDIISDLLDLEKIMAGATPLAIEEFSLTEMIQAVADLQTPLAVSKGIELRLPVSGEEITVTSDGLKVRQVLLNLLNNALKFTDEGFVAVEAWVDDLWCYVAVEDTGRGMTPQQLEQAFVEFQQVDDASDRVSEGTGLGLSIAARLARLLGGELTADSALGTGSKFTLKLAVHLEEPSSTNR